MGSRRRANELGGYRDLNSAGFGPMGVEANKCDRNFGSDTTAGHRS